jgi:hypothetical protein
VTLTRSHGKRIARQTWFMYLAVQTVGLLITGSALLDQLFGLGWGYDWNTVFMGIGISLFGGLVWLACRSVFRVMGAE